MSQVYALDHVIRRVTPDYTTFDPAERIVILDAKRRSIVPKKPLFTFADLRYYVVQTSNNAKNFATGQINDFKLQDLSYSLVVTLAYEVRCKPGNEMRAAVALFDEAASPGEMLERAIAEWLFDLRKMGIPELVQAYLRDKTAIEAKLEAKALSETGLDLNVRIVLNAEQSLNPITVTKDHLRVRMRDYQAEHQQVSFRMTLDVDDRRRANAILAYGVNSTLHEVVPREVVRFFLEEVTMETFCTNLNTGEVREALARHLDPVLAPYGRRVGGVRLEGDAPPLNFFFQKVVNVPCRLHEYPEEVVILNEVQMILHDISRYKSASAPDLTEWLQKKLNRVIPQLLFGVKYIDVLIRFANFEQEIKKILSTEATAIGYEIKQLITVPDLEPIRLREPTLLNASGTFELRLPNFHVSLQSIVTMRIPRLETVEEYLNRLQNVPKLMEDAVVSLTRQYLHGVEPERFYMRFGFSEVEGELPVEQELVGKIRERLKTDFGAEVIDVVVKVGDTDIIKRLRDLQNQICPFEVDLASLHPSETIVVQGNFQVEGVDSDGWSRFQQLTIGMTDIARLLAQHIYAQLQSAKPELIQFRDPLHQQKFETVVGGMAMRYMREQFGLIVRITNVRRSRTLIEQRTADVMLADSNAPLEARLLALGALETSNTAATREKLDRLELLLRDRTRLAVADGAEEELEELDRRIREAQEGLTPERVLTYGDVQHALQVKRSSDLSFDDLAKLKDLPIERGPAGGEAK
jgi:hypothetical protein